MEKKTYITPAIAVVHTKLLTALLSLSAGNANITIDNVDDNTYEQRSRRFFWDDDWDE